MNNDGADFLSIEHWSEIDAKEFVNGFVFVNALA